MTTIETWQIGAITLSALVEKEGPTSLEDVCLEMSSQGKLPATAEVAAESIRNLTWLQDGWLNTNGGITWRVQSFLVEADGKRYIIDTGIGNDKVRAVPDNTIHTTFLDDLRAAGWEPEDVDGVILTHLHIDHVGWNTTLVDGQWVPTFPNAAYCFVGGEYEHWRAYAADPEADRAYVNDWARDQVDGAAVYFDSIKPVVDAGLVRMVTGDAEIAPGISLQPTVGHTPGHSCVNIRSAGEHAVVTGDLMHYPFQISYPDWSCVLDSDLTSSALTRGAAVNSWRDDQALVFGTHFGGPVAGRVAQFGDYLGLQAQPGKKVTL